MTYLRLLAAVGASLTLIAAPSAGKTAGGQRAKEERFTVSNVFAQLPNSRAQARVTFDFDVTAQGGTSLNDVVADVFMMAPDRTIIGQEGSSHPTVSPGKLHFHIDPPTGQNACPPKLYPQQLIVLSRYSAILEVVPIRPTVVPSSVAGGCN